MGHCVDGLIPVLLTRRVQNFGFSAQTEGDTGYDYQDAYDDDYDDDSGNV